MKKLCMAVAIMALFAASSVQAEDDAGQLVSLRAGEVSFTLLQSDGVTPMSAAPIKMLATDDSRVLAEAVSDHLGQAAVALSEGRYLLNVSGRTLAVLEATADAATTSCRVVIPDAALMVAGEEGEEDEEVAGGPVWLKPVMIGGVVVLVAVGGYAIYDNNDDDGDGGAGDGGEGEGGTATTASTTGGGDDGDDDAGGDVPSTPSSDSSSSSSTATGGSKDTGMGPGPVSKK